MAALALLYLYMNKKYGCRSNRGMQTPARLLMAFLIWPGFVTAKDAGTTAFNFLKLGVGPRAIGMGEAQVGLADDAYATWWNPAGLAQLERPEIALTHHSYVQSINQQYLAGAWPTKRWGTVAASVNYWNYGDIPGFDAAGQATSSFDAHDMAFGLSYGRSLYADRRKASQLSAGITGKWLRESIADTSATAFAGDIGVHWAAGKSLGSELEGFRAGLAIRNLGTSAKFDRDEFSLPRLLAAGIAWTGSWRQELLTIALDTEQPEKGNSAVSGGLELWTLRTFVIRGGYTSKGDIGNGLRLGAGFRFQTVQVDYAYSNQGDFGSAHRVGMNFRFGKPPENQLVLAESWYEKGVKDFRRARYTDALVNFNKALEIDPQHPQALAMMKQTYEKLKATGAGGDFHE